jgi:hypothetical protein
MKNNIVSILLVILLFHVKRKRKHQYQTQIKLRKYKEGFVLGLWELYPDWAANQGYHKWTVFWDFRFRE